MENNNQTPENRWVEDRLAALQPGSEFRPDTSRALARLRDRRYSRSLRGRRWIAVAAVSVATSLSLMALPAPRALAERYAAACGNEAAHMCQYLMSHDALMDFHYWVASLVGFHPPRHEARLAPDFTLTDASGQMVKLSDYRGRVVLLNFWATWCSPCREETPWFVEFQEKFRDRNFVVLGVSLDDDGWKSVKPFMEARKVNYPVMLGDGKVDTLYGVKNLPETMIIDRSGRIAVNCTGLIGKDDYQTQIEAVLNNGAKL